MRSFVRSKYGILHTRKRLLKHYSPQNRKVIIYRRWNLESTYVYAFVFCKTDVIFAIIHSLNSTNESTIVYIRVHTILLHKISSCFQNKGKNRIFSALTKSIFHYQNYICRESYRVSNNQRHYCMGPFINYVDKILIPPPLTILLQKLWYVEL